MSNPNREEALFALALEKPMEECGAVSGLELRDNLQRLALGRLQFGQRRDAFVQRGQHAAPAEGETEQISIRHLLMTDEPCPGKSDGFREGQIIRPERMIFRGGVGSQHTHGFPRGNGIAGERGIRHDAGYLLDTCSSRCSGPVTRNMTWR